MSQQTVLKIWISLRETFSNSIFLRVMKWSDKTAFVEIFKQRLEPFKILTLKGCSKEWYLGISLITSLAVSNFENISAMRLIFLFKMSKSWCKFQNSRKYSENCLYYIIAFEVVVVTSHYYKEKTYDRQSVC